MTHPDRSCYGCVKSETRSIYDDLEMNLRENNEELWSTAKKMGKIKFQSDLWFDSYEAINLARSQQRYILNEIAASLLIQIANEYISKDPCTYEEYGAKIENFLRSPEGFASARTAVEETLPALCKEPPIECENIYLPAVHQVVLSARGMISAMFS